MIQPNDVQGSRLRWSEHIVPILKHPDVHIRDKALVAVAWEAHPRWNELLRLRFEDIEDRDEYLVLHLTHRSGSGRELILNGSMPYLRKWLQDHPVAEQLDGDTSPLKDADPGAPLWTGTSRNTRLCTNQLLAIMERVCDQAGVTANLTIGNIRRSRAIKLALELGLRAPALRSRFGWPSSGDETPVEHGAEERITAELSAPIRCPSCGEQTPHYQACIWCESDR